MENLVLSEERQLFMKKFYRSSENKVFAGIIGGAGEYFEVDPVLLRVAYLLIVAFTGFIPGIIAYILAGLIVPKRV
jgi:phage shock protein C